MPIARLWHFLPSSELFMPAVSSRALYSLSPSQENAVHVYTYLLNLQLLEKSITLMVESILVQIPLS